MKLTLTLGLLPLLTLTAGGDRPVTDLARTPVVKELVQPVFDREAKEAQEVTRSALKGGVQIQAQFKMPVVLKGLPDPWTGLTQLERDGLRIAAASDNPAMLLDRLSAAIGKPVGTPAPIKRKQLAGLDDHVSHMI